MHGGDVCVCHMHEARLMNSTFSKNVVSVRIQFSRGILRLYIPGRQFIF